MSLSVTRALALTFNFTTSNFPDTPTADAYLAAAQQAGNLWSANFSDAITVNVVIQYTAGMGTSVGDNSPVSANYAYTAVNTALFGDIHSADDTTAYNHLQVGTTLTFGVNRGSPVQLPWHIDPGNTGTTADDNNKKVQITNADAKALGLLSATAPGIDITVKVNSTLVTALTYDLDRSNGVNPAQYDLVGALAHEIGHGMGMTSLAEILSSIGSTQSEVAMVPRLADLFRFSTRSATDPVYPGSFDAAADTVSKYFSIDGGTTAIAQFALGSSSTLSGFGNGQQANHWLGAIPKTGIMDPVIGLGQQINFSPIDSEFFDVLGFDAVPEASTWAAGIVLIAGGGWICRRQRGA